ncbi:MAG: MogA/MoaB family molybdenum cofactor biosynthesis protein [Acidimicrobiia bacterium]|nr:MogA/MoaB family molybdenum cofactor biosynthesis protein [Acidimicrobiia bacterium]
MMRAAVITVSDRVSRGEATDTSGPAAVGILDGLGFDVGDPVVVPDGIDSVAQAIRALAATGAQLIITTGGTGFAARDLTPEATAQVIERPAPGLSEAMRSATFGQNPHGMLSRGVSGIVGNTLVMNLPGSQRGVEESLEVVGPALRHAVELLQRADSDHNTATAPDE